MIIHGTVLKTTFIYLKGTLSKKNREKKCLTKSMLIIYEKKIQKTEKRKKIQS